MKPTRRFWPAALFGVAVLILGSLVALGALARPGEGSSRLSIHAWDLRNLVGGAAIACLVILTLGMLIVQSGPRRKLQPQRSSPVSFLVILFLIAALVVFLRNLAPLELATDDEATPGGVSVVEAEPAQPRGTEWGLIVLIAATGLVLIAAAAGRRALRSAEGVEPPLDEVTSVLDEALTAISLGDDPRDVVIGCFAGLEAVFALRGHPRGSSETGTEYVDRVLLTLRVAPETAGRLTRLFLEARYSTAAIDTAMAREAREALESIRDELS